VDCESLLRYTIIHAYVCCISGEESHKLLSSDGLCAWYFFGMKTMDTLIQHRIQERLLPP